jgi:hypothetical protein
VATLVTGYDLQTRSRRETNSRNKRILEPDVVHIVVAGVPEEFARGLVASEETI